MKLILKVINLKNYENVFVPDDAASHINLPSRVIFIRKAFNKLGY